MKKRFDLETGKKLPDISNFSSIQQRLGTLGINDDMYKDKAEYFEEELKNTLAKLERLEKDIIKLKKDKVVLQNRINELEEEYLSDIGTQDNKMDRDTVMSLLAGISDPMMFAKLIEGMRKK